MQMTNSSIVLLFKETTSNKIYLSQGESAYQDMWRILELLQISGRMNENKRHQDSFDTPS